MTDSAVAPPAHPRATAASNRWLRDFAVLDAVRPDDAARLAAAAQRHSAQPDGALVHEVGAPCLQVYLVLEGAVSLQAIPRGGTEVVELRRVGRGEAFGLEAAFGARTRHARAVCLGTTEVIELPAELFARTVRRAGGAASRLERAVRRGLTDERLRTLAFTRALPDAERALVLDMARERHVEAGATIYREGQRADAMFLLAAGMVRLFTTRADGARHVRAYLGAGDFFGEHETLAGTPWRLGAEAVGPCELLVLGRSDVRTVVQRNPGLLEAMQRIAFDRQQAQHDAFTTAPAAGDDLDYTRHLFEDVYRASVATELLAIDLERCVQCGTCAWSCHETHGQARLVRRGDKVLAPAGDDGHAAPLLLPNSCQHCTDPACMVDCPTGAIGRDPEGEVFINPDTCVGCEACAKACPWDNISLASLAGGPALPAGGRPSGAGGAPLAPGGPAAPAGGPHASGARQASVSQVAVKCDLCRGHGGVSACVVNCPTGAIVRLDPRQESAPLRALLGLEAIASGDTRHDAKRETAPTRLVVLLIVLVLGVAGVLGRARGLVLPFTGVGLAAGVLGGVSMLWLASYGLRKRLIGRLMRARRERPQGRRPRALAWHLRAHLGAAAVLFVAVLVHSGGWASSVMGTALLAALGGSLALGGVGALLYRWVPARIARVVARPHLPEDFVAEETRLRLAVRDVLSGRDDAKRRAAAALMPVLTLRAAPWRELWRGQDRHALRARLLEAACAAGAEPPDDATRHALDRATRLTCEHLGLRVERLGQRLLTGWVLPHIVLSTVALVLMLVHTWQGIAVVWLAR